MKKRSQSSKAGHMTMYEKERLNKLELNASRMEAAGLGTLAKKILASNYESVAKKLVSERDVSTDEFNSDDLLNGDGDYQPSENDDGEEEVCVVQKSAPVKKGLRQQTTMLELAIARSRKKISSSQQQPIQSEKEDNNGDERDLVQHSTPVKKDARQQTMAEFAMTRARKKLPTNQQQPAAKRKLELDSSRKQKRVQPNPKGQRAPQQTLQPKKVQSQAKSNTYCAPGSLALYQQMKLRQ